MCCISPPQTYTHTFLPAETRGGLMRGFVRGLRRSAGINYPAEPRGRPPPVPHTPIGPGAAFKPQPGAQALLELWCLCAVFVG